MPRHLATVVTMVAALVLGGLVSVPKAAMACSCAVPDGSPAPADAVFTGTAIARQDVPSGARSAQHLDWTFAVDDVRKGPVATARQVVRSGAHGASCGYGFEVGGRYVVYATVVEDRLFTGLCTGTAPIAAQEVPAATGTARTSTSESLTVTG